jgi:hypothetical protein
MDKFGMESITIWIGSVTWDVVAKEDRWSFGPFDLIEKEPEKEFFYVLFSYLKEKRIRFDDYAKNVIFLSFCEKNKEKYKNYSAVEFLLLHEDFMSSLCIYDPRQPSVRHDSNPRWDISDSDFSLDQDFLDFINQQANN